MGTGARSRDRSTGVTPKQETFVREFLKNGGNSAEAYRTAYNTKKRGNALWVKAAATLKHPRVIARMRELQAPALKKVGISVERWAQEVAAIAFFDPRGIFRDDGSFKPVHEWTQEQAAALAGIDYEEIAAGRGANRKVIGRISKVRFAAKAPILDQIAKRLRLYVGEKDPGDDNTATIRVPLSRVRQLMVAVVGGGESSEMDRAGAGRLVLPAALPAQPSGG